MNSKVVSIITRMNVGGPAILIKELDLYLAASEFEHILITGKCGLNEIDYQEMSGHKFSKVYKLRWMARPISIHRDFLSFFELYFLLRRIQPSIVHTHTSKAGLIGRCASAVAAPKAKIIHTYHGHLLYGYFSSLFLSTLVIAERLLSNITDVLIAVSLEVKRDLTQIGVGTKSKWEIIPPGVSTKALGRQPSRKVFNYPDNLFVITWVGRMTKIKDPRLALEAVAKLKCLTNREFILNIVGGGELLDECEAYASNNNLPVVFHGWLEDPALLLNASDLNLVTSENEGLPLIILESASAGIPTLAPNVGGVNEFIKDFETGFFCERTAGGIATSLSVLMGNSNILRKIGKNAMRFYEMRFTPKRYSEAHMKIYRSLIKDRT